MVFSVTVSNMIYRQIPDKNDKRSLASACFDMSYFVRSWISRGSGWQTERADCNYIFEKIKFLDNYFNKDKSVGL